MYIFISLLLYKKNLNEIEAYSPYVLIDTLIKRSVEIYKWTVIVK